MKHIYYGKRKKPVIFVNEADLRMYRYGFSLEIKKLQVEAIERCINRLKEDKMDGILLTRRELVMNDDMFIVEKEHEHVLEVGDKVELDEHNGVVEDREYDAINDIMHYKTDITVKVDKNEEDDKRRIAEIKKDLLPRLEKMLIDINREIEIHHAQEESRNKKGFWASLFNL